MTEEEKKTRRVKNLMMFLVVLHQEHDHLEELMEKGTSKTDNNYYQHALHYLNSRIKHYRSIIKSIK